MKKRAKKTGAPSERRLRLEHETEGITGGAIVGATIGAMGGPPGVVVGVLVGGAVGGLAAAVVDTASKERGQHNKDLDAEIGVSGGDLGAANLEHPPAKVGAYSAASSGSDAAPPPPAAEGPMQPPED